MVLRKRQIPRAEAIDKVMIYYDIFENILNLYNNYTSITILLHKMPCVCT
jgi:hypothetical protein